MKFLRLFGASLLLILGLLLSGGAYLAFTETGLQWLLAQVTWMVPGELQVQQAEGRLGTALTLRGLRYRTAEFSLEVEHLDFAWQGGALLHATLWVDQLHLRGVTWRQLGPAAPRAPEEAITLPEVQLPLQVRVESLQVQDLTLLAYEASPVAIEAIIFKGHFKDQTLQLAKLSVVAPEGRFRVGGALTLRGAYPLAVTTHWSAQVPELGALTGVGEVTGDLRQLTLRQELRGPLQLQLRGRFLDLVDDLRWAVILDVPATDLQQLQPQWPAVRLGMNLRGGGRISRFKVQGSYSLEEAQVGKIQGKFSGEQITPTRWILHQFNLQQKEGKARVAVHGDVALREDQPHVSLQGQWQDLAWPLVGPALVASDKGQVTFAGHPESYRLQVQAALAGEDLPTSEWYLAGTGDTTQFRLETLQTHLLDGVLHGAGSIRWDPPLTWQLRLDGETLNPAKKWLEWPGELDFHLATRGTFHDDRRAMTINLQTLTGTLRGYPVRAQGDVQLQDATWQITDLQLHSGASRFSIGGRIEEQSALAWQLNSPDLAQLLPAAAGSLAGRGRLDGRLEQPQVSLQLEGNNLAYQAFRLASIEADVHLDLEGTQSSQFAVNATGLALDEQMLRSLNLQGRGTPSQHVLRLTVAEGPERSLTLQTRGAWREETWEGEIRTAQITDPVGGSWAMAQATPLILSRHRVDLAPWCWRQQEAQLCLGGTWRQEQDWKANFKAVNFPLGTLAPFLPEGMILEGTLESKAQIRGVAHRLEQALVQLNVVAGRFVQKLPEKETLTLPYQDLRAELRLDKGESRGSFKWLLDEQGKMRLGASLGLPPIPLDLTALEAPLTLFDNRWQGQGWEADLDIVDFPLPLLAPFLPAQMRLEGAFGANARLRGEGHYLEQAQIQLNTSPGRLLQEMPEEETLALLHQGLQAELRVNKAEGSGRFEWLLAELGTASLDADPLSVILHLPPAPWDLTALERLSLEGRVTAAVNELTFLELLLPELRETRGQLRLDLALGGQVREPQVLGQIGLQNGYARVPPLGLELTQIQLRVEAREVGTVNLNGKVHSGEGQMALQGRVRLDPAAGWPGQLSIVGEGFEAARTPEVAVSISPRLQVTLAERRIQVEGEVTVPKARLSPVDVRQRGGVSASEDVVIISEAREVPPEARGMPVHARVRVILGDKVAVEAYGFTGQIAGSLLVTDAPERRTRGSGELQVSGQYAAYGVQLDIQEGRVIFVGPIDTPRVDVRAVRRVGNVVAGVQVRGPADAPVLTLFSEPTMNEQSVLAYLILGRPLRSASGEEGEMLANAAVSIGLSGGNLLAQRIGRTFGLERVGIEEVGIEEVGVDAERDPQRAALMLGRHLSPRLYVGYGIGIFQRFNAFRMRYLLTESWSLQAETGLESSVDLFYNLER